MFEELLLAVQIPISYEVYKTLLPPSLVPKLTSCHFYFPYLSSDWGVPSISLTRTSSLLQPLYMLFFFLGTLIYHLPLPVFILVYFHLSFRSLKATSLGKAFLPSIAYFCQCKNSTLSFALNFLHSTKQNS